MEDLKPRAANSCPQTPLTLLERATTVYGESISIIYNDTIFTWSETHRRCLRLASSLVTFHGIKKGDVVSVIAPNIPAMFELQFAVPMAGAVLNNISPRLDAKTISESLVHSESKLVFADCLSRDLVLETVSLFPPGHKQPILVLIADDHIEITTPAIDDDFVSTYEDMVQKGDPRFIWIRPRSEWDPMVLNYTSGTTSTPKGVVHSHRGIFNMTLMALIDWGVPLQPVYLLTLPIVYANGWSYPWGMAAVGGITICLRKFDTPLVYQLIKKHGVTHMCVAPALLLNELSNSPNVKPLENPVKVRISGVPPPAVVIFRTEALGFDISHAYGLTETAGEIASCAWKPEWNMLPANERAKLKTRQGVKIPGFTEIDVLDPKTEQSVKRDGVTLGDVVVKGVCVMLGYLKDPIKTSNCLRENGWLYTGDVGVMHSDGYLEVKDRAPDMIYTEEGSVSSMEIESVIYLIPSVNEAAVVAKKDFNGSQVPCAFLTLKEGFAQKPTESDIIEFCKERLARYLVPKKVVIKKDLPKTSTGKIQKFVLREMANSLDLQMNGV